MLLWSLFQAAPPRPGARHWVVVLEATGGADASPCDHACFDAIIRALRDHGATGLHGPDRYALQLRVTGDDIGSAFAFGLARWRDVARPLTPAGWSLVRAEVLTQEELDRELGAQR